MDNDALINLWNDGALDGLHARAKASTHPTYLKGYKDGQRLALVRPVMPPRPEGYYHVNPNGEV